MFNFKKNIWVYIVLISITKASSGLTLNNSKDLKFFADALNIEGGKISKYQLNEKQLWANLCVILDTPLSNGVNLNQISGKNKFSLKEMSIPEYNEKKVNYMYLLSLTHYLEHARNYIKKKPWQPIKIVAQIHRNSSAQNHYNLLKRLLSQYYSKNALSLLKIKNKKANVLDTYYYKPTNIYLEFRKGYQSSDLVSYDKADIVYSFSLAAGISDKLVSSDMMLPTSFVPFNIKNLKFDTNKGYIVKNHLLNILEVMLKYQDPKLRSIIDSINSENKIKYFTSPDKLKLSDFRMGVIAESNGLFNPNS